MAGYAFAKKRFPGRDALMWAFLATMMVPFQATLIPLFILISDLNGADTFWGLIVPTLANSQAVFLMRQFIRDLPDELFEAAKVDGAPEWRIYLQIVVPLTKPILATLGVFVFLWHWNDFLWPLVATSSEEMRTLTVGLSTLRGEQFPQSMEMAAAAISVVPCLAVFFLLQRYLAPGVLALAVMSTAFTGQAIATGFERRYGVLKRLGATPLSRAGLMLAKTLAVLAVEALQVVVIVAVALALGWRPQGSFLGAVLLVLLGTAAFSGLGLLMAGVLRAEATLAAANLVYLVLLGAGGVVFPLSKFPEGLRSALELLPISALTGGLRAVLRDGAALPLGALAVLAVWAVLTLGLASRTFRWE
ncbi:ABC transporter permease subunit [Nonomuraea sp. NPDC055795]